MIKRNLVIENANIFSRNFSGKEGQYNPAGRRNFCVFVDYEQALIMEDEGWNVRWLKPKDEDDERQAFVQVSVSFDNIPPKVLLISSRGKTLLDRESVDILDYAEIKSIDLVVRPYNWNVGGNSGVKAYLKSLYVTIVEDELDYKYLNVPDSAADSIGGCGRCDVCDGGCDHD